MSHNSPLVNYTLNRRVNLILLFAYAYQAVVMESVMMPSLVRVPIFLMGLQLASTAHFLSASSCLVISDKL